MSVALEFIFGAIFSIFSNINYCVMNSINRNRLAVGIFSLSCLNFSLTAIYPMSNASANERRVSSELFQSAGLDHFQIASRPPWEQPSDGTTPYVLPPWGLTVNDFFVTRQMPLYAALPDPGCSGYTKLHL
jgi:hypothetical protein